MKDRHVLATRRDGWIQFTVNSSGKYFIDTEQRGMKNNDEFSLKWLVLLVIADVLAGCAVLRRARSQHTDWRYRVVDHQRLYLL
jgi:hypothetical protein